MSTEERILHKFGLTMDDSTAMPIEIPSIGRKALAELFRELDFKVGVEIGVREGRYSEILCKANPELKLYGIDPYVAHEGYRDHIKNEAFDGYYQEAKTRLVQYKNYQFVKDFSLEALRAFEDQSLDFVYIDGNHNFKNCAEDISEWTKKVKFGGIISGHDFEKYRRPTRIHCYEVVNGYTTAYDIKPWFITSSRVVEDGQEYVEARSWFWVNRPFASPKGKRE